MKYMRQLAIIFAVTCVGEIMNHYIPLPIPAGVYGLVLMFLLLITRIVKLEHVENAADFLIEIMPLMFIPAGVKLMTSWGQLRSIIVPVLVIMVVSTFAVMIVTGKVTDLFCKDKSDENAPRKEEA